MTPDTEALRGIPGKYAQPDPATLAKLPKPTKADNPKGQCSVCNGYHGLPAIHIDYQGHADITLTLIEIDPLWNWEPMGLTEDGQPVITLEGKLLVMWAKLTVLGKTIIGVGTCEASKGEPQKELIGDFLRNGAMRFGVATRLWSKADRADPAGSDEGGGYDQPRRGRKASETHQAAPPSADKVAEQELAVRFSQLNGADKAAVTKAAKEIGVSNVMKAGEHVAAVHALIDGIHQPTELAPDLGPEEPF